jgi:hypothetical protein
MVVFQRLNALPTSTSYITVTLQNVPTGFAINSGTYKAWCSDDSNAQVVAQNAALPISTYSPNLPANIQSPNWPKVNYILNNKQGNFRDVQRAIWLVLRGSASYFTDTPAVLAMVSAANTLGANFVPAAGQIQAVLLYQDGFGSNQDTIIEVPVGECGVVGDLVWRDDNRNGIQDVGEAGINGVNVTLYNSSGQAIASTVTQTLGTQTGSYRFAGLCTGNYSVQASTPAGLVPSLAGAGSDRSVDSNGAVATATIDLSDVTKRQDLTLDFGFNSACTGTIGDFVWRDDNFNGVQDPGEPGIPNVTVQLLDAGGTQVLGTATTNAVGGYSFAGQCNGTYQVRVSSGVPAGYVSTGTGLSTPSTDSNLSPATVTLPAVDSVDNTIDFGFKPPCTGVIGNFAWHDMNRNGVQDGGEPGLNGITVNLKNASGSLFQSVTTSMNAGLNGYYQFTGVCAGNYSVEYVSTTVPTGFLAATTGAGTSATDSNTVPAAVVLSSNSSSDETIDFGFQIPCSGKIGNFVWEDLDRDGIQDAGEPGISGIIVNLRNASDNALVATTTTDALGRYEFTGRCGGSYKVEAVLAGWASSPLGAGTQATDSNPNAATLTLADNASDDTIDFGFYRGSIGDRVWRDTDGDGVQEGGESGLSGATVQLRSGSGNVIGTTTTTVDGLYSFGSLVAGNYTVCVAGVPAGFVQTHDLDGLATANCATATLAAGQARVDVDFGYKPIPPVASCVDITAVQGVALTPMSLIGSGGAGAPYTFTAVGLPMGLSISSTGTISGTPATSGTASYTVTVKDKDGNSGTLSCSVNVNPPPVVCAPLTFAFTGNSALSGTAGNIRTFTAGNVQVNASAFTRSTSGAWSTAFLGAWSQGLGVTDNFEGNGNNTHKVDNAGGHVNYVMFEFSSPVIVNRAFLDAIGDDSDMSVWIGNKSIPFANHLTLSDAVLTSLSAVEENSNNSDVSSRWADINSANLQGNVIVIAARASDSARDDEFKISKLETHCPQPPSSCSGVIGNLVWKDANGNGVQDSSESGIADVLVQLKSGSTVVASTTTNSSGNYQFTNRCAGTYSVVIPTAPPGYSASPNLSGANRTLDSNGSPASVTLAANNSSDQSIDFGFVPLPACAPGTFAFTGSSAFTGTAGNIRAFSANGMQVKASAFSRTTNGTWATAFLGVWSQGLGVTDGSENGNGDTHKVDNAGRLNYVLFEFTTPVVVNRALLDSIGADSDISVWIGTKTNPFTNHLTLSDSLLNSLGTYETNSSTTTVDSRWADINAGNVKGNVLVIAAKTSDNDDAFKISKLDVRCQ